MSAAILGVIIVLSILLVSSAIAPGGSAVKRIQPARSFVPPSSSGTASTLLAEARASLSSMSDQDPQSLSSSARLLLSTDSSSIPNWSRLQPTSSPEARFGVAMTYDAADGYVLLFGGYGPGGVFGYGFENQTWTFQNGTWTERFPAVSPSPRLSAAMAYDAADGYVVLFGGCGVVLASTASCPPALNDTWTYRGGAWNNITPGVSPSPRYYAGMTYDEADGYVLLFGGESTLDQSLADTWEFSAGKWTELDPSSYPSPRDAFAFTYDAADGYVLLFGGVPYADTWAYKSGNWVNITTTVAPSPRLATEAAYDPAGGFVLLYAGLGISGSEPNDTWTFRAGTWANVTPDVSPGWRTAEGMTFDSATGQVILFGGWVGGSILLNDTWVFSSSMSLAPNPSVGFNVHPTSCGAISWDGQPYSNGTLGFYPPGVYLAQAGPCTGFSFEGWSGSGGVVPLGIELLDTEVSLNASGTLTATFVPVYSISVGVNPILCGPIQLGAALLGPDAVINLTSGDYAVLAPSCFSMTFSIWQTSGDVSVQEKTNASTSVMVSGSGRIVATYVPRMGSSTYPFLEAFGTGLAIGAIALATAWLIDRRRMPRNPSANSGRPT
jgi:hypothetical protein